MITLLVLCFLFLAAYLGLLRLIKRAEQQREREEREAAARLLTLSSELDQRMFTAIVGIDAIFDSGDQAMAEIARAWQARQSAAFQP